MYFVIRIFITKVSVNIHTIFIHYSYDIINVVIFNMYHSSSIRLMAGASSWLRKDLGRKLAFVALASLLIVFFFGGLSREALPREIAELTSQRPNSEISLEESNVDQRNEQYQASKLFCTSVHRTAQTEHQKCHLAHMSNVNRKNVLPFRNKHVNRTAVLLCTGPTLSQYKHAMTDEQGNDIITVGVNGIIFSDSIRKSGLDYLFLQDTGRLSKSSYVHAFHKNVRAYTKFRCNIQKFYGMYQEIHIEPTDIELSEGNAIRYEMRIPECGEILPLVDDIGHYTLGGSCSVAFSALQFILYTGIRKLRLVGCDVTEGAHAGEDTVAVGKIHDRLMDAWKLVPGFVRRYYPLVSIEVVRPVGLAGIFEEAKN